jgi:pyruvate, water dikinase
MRRRICYLILALIPVNQWGQSIYSGRIIDTNTKNPVSNAEVSLLGSDIKATTDNIGRFSFATVIDDVIDNPEYKLTTSNDKLCWISNKKIDISITSLLGQETGMNWKSLTGRGEISLGKLAETIYLLSVSCNGSSKTFKICKSNHSLQIGKTEAGVYNSRKSHLKNATFTDDTIYITKDEYYTQKYAYQNADETYEILKMTYNDVDYLDKIIRPEAFTLLQGLPLNPTFGEVKSIKIVYSINDGLIYYSNSAKYFIHFDFCEKVLGYGTEYQPTERHSRFNQEQYTKNSKRLYILASINHFTSSDIYTLDFFSGDELDCNDIKTVYDKVVATSFVGNKLRFYANNMAWAKCTNVPIISSDELYKGQNYQPLSVQESYGYLKKIDISVLGNTYLGRHDIVLLNGIPIDIGVVAGIITTDFQTPLSHINVLSHNRGTPNMALRDGWTNTKLNSLLDKLVYLKVTLDSFIIREADISTARAFWALKEPQTIKRLNIDTISSGLSDLANETINSVSKIGGKAANFAELRKINVPNYGPLPLPEGSFAIPFYYYWKHLKKYGLDRFISKMLTDPLFITNAAERQRQLQLLQDSIIKCPADNDLMTLVNTKVASIKEFKNLRFRSSTNAEDVEGFNGAGLYESFTGKLNDPDKPIDLAIKKVWASLWYYPAFEERDYFKIDQKTVAMGVLVHRSFPDEMANGVVITKNLYNPYNPAITINVQFGDISIVNPDGNYLPDQIIYYTYSSTEDIIEYVNHTTLPTMAGFTVMTDAELKVLKDYCLAIHYHYCILNLECRPMDIEFKVDWINETRKVYIKQARLY